MKHTHKNDKKTETSTDETEILDKAEYKIGKQI